MPPTRGLPGGAGELGVGTTMAATACAYYKATGKFPTEFPINHKEPLNFVPFPVEPPIPQSPTDGLKLAGIKRPVKKKKTTKTTTAKKAS
jgi:isoquinoline 1-oxidoreductase beta subunit